MIDAQTHLTLHRRRLALAAALGALAALAAAAGAVRQSAPAAGAQSACYGDFADLRGWWPLDEDAPADTASDVVGGNTARHVGGPAVAVGHGGLARAFGRNAQWSEVRAPATALDVATTDFTIDAWIRLPLATSRAMVSRTGKIALAEKASSAGGAGYAFYLDSGFLGLQLTDADRRSAAFSSRSGPSIGSGGGLLPVDADWHFVAVAVRRTGPSAGVQFMLDGVTTAATGATGGRPGVVPPASLANDSPFRFGRRMAGSGSGGSPMLLDDVELFTRALGTTELDAIRLRGKCAPTREATGTGTATPTGTPTTTPTATPTATATATLTATVTVTATSTLTPTATATATIAATATGPANDSPSPTPTSEATATSGSTPRATLTSTPTATPTPTAAPACTSAPPDIAGWWPLDEGAGGVALDLSGAGHHGALYGSAGWQPAGAVRGALTFDGLTAYVEAPDAAGLDVPAATGPAPQGDFTIELWLRRRERGGALQAVFDKLTRDQGYGLLLADGRPVIYLASAGQTVPTPFNVTLGLDGVWHHLAVVLDRHDASSSARLFVDGARVAAGASLVTGTLDNGVPVRIGASNLSPYLPFSGDLDEVTLYQRALGDAEVAAVAAAGAGGKCKPTDMLPTAAP